MGYKLTSLGNLPLEDDVDMYVFSVGDELWEGGLGEIVKKNFDNIAREIGGNSIIVGALTEEFHDEVVQTYLGKNHAALKNLMPALLITDAHPDALTDESMRLIIPLREAHRRYDIIDEFLHDLAAFVRGDNDKLIQALSETESATEIAADVVSIKIPIVPGVVAVNVNGAVSRLRKWWNQRKKANAGKDS